MPITATDSSRIQIYRPAFGLVVALLGGAGLLIFTPARWHFDLNDPDFFPLNLLLPLVAVFGLYQAVKVALAWRRRTAGQHTGSDRRHGRAAPG
jgi:Ni/Fe-hydrogenase subunit HybB-like protein